MSDVAGLPRDLVTLEEWDALELDEARRWELVEGGIVITPRPRPLHQVVSMNLAQLIRAALPASLVVLPEVEIGKGCRIKNVVIDRRCTLPEGLVIGEGVTMADFSAARSKFSVCRSTSTNLSFRPYWCSGL